ncbi:MAG: succinate dehydrogenase (quinone) flavoprotein subunit, partial [Desulfobacterales bacterium]|nr:succinate dehydrogenase (quinone) flavoprotein subunit [Desulfobacterales bacterium]
NVSAAMAAYRKGALFANPCFTQIHPTCIPVHGPWQSKLTLMSESLRNDGRVWVPKHSEEARKPEDIPEEDRDYYLEAKYPSFGNLVPRDVASRNAKEQCDAGKGVGETGYAVYLDFRDAIKRDGRETIERKYGNLFAMYERITAEDPYSTPMRIYPASHYSMGGLWVDYNLMTTIPGLFALGEANFSDHGANRLGASALMQGLADGYFIIPYTLGGYLADRPYDAYKETSDAFAEAERAVEMKIKGFQASSGSRTSDDFHRELGLVMWDHCGMARGNQGLDEALGKIEALQAGFKNNLAMGGATQGFDQTLEKAMRVSDFLEFSKVMVSDARARQESCGSHFNTGFQTEENEALRDDVNFAHVAAWKYMGDEKAPERVVEPLSFENVKLVQ